MLSSPSSPKVRENVKMVSEKIQIILEKEDYVLNNPRSSLINMFGMLQGKLPKNSGVIYYIEWTGENGEWCLKVGMTKVPLTRLRWYQLDDENGFLTILFYFDRISLSAHNALQETIMDWLSTKLVENPEIPFPLRQFFRMVVKRGAGYLGMYRAVCLQLCEISIQQQHHFSYPMEGFAFDQSVWDQRILLMWRRFPKIFLKQFQMRGKGKEQLGFEVFCDRKLEHGHERREIVDKNHFNGSDCWERFVERSAP